MSLWLDKIDTIIRLLMKTMLVNKDAALIVRALKSQTIIFKNS